MFVNRKSGVMIAYKLAVVVKLKSVMTVLTYIPVKFVVWKSVLSASIIQLKIVAIVINVLMKVKLLGVIHVIDIIMTWIINVFSVGVYFVKTVWNVWIDVRIANNYGNVIL